MNNVNFNEVDSTEEVCKVINRVIDNLNQAEGKLLHIIADRKTDKNYNKAVEEYNGDKVQKGIVSMKVLLMLFVATIIMVFAGNVSGYVTTDINDEIASNHVLLAQYLRDSFANVTSDSFLFSPRATAPSGTFAAEGRVYYDSVSKTLQLHNGTSFTPLDTAGGVSLDSAYNFGSAGGGRAIGVTDGAITMTKDDGGTENVLEISASPSGSADGDGILVTLGTNSTGVGIQFALGAGATNDLAGTGDTWTISKAGAFAGVGGTWTGDHLFTGNAANIEVDVSQDAIHFLDNSILAIGGATTAAGDFTFSYDGTDFNLEAAAANDLYRMGETTHFDLVIHGATNTNEVTFDTDDSALLCIFDGFDLRMNDDDVLRFGDSSEFTVEYDEDGTDNLIMLAANANDAVQIGDGTTGTDLKMMGATSGDFVLFDASADELFFEDCDLKINEGAQIEFAVADNSVDWTIDVSTDEILLFLPAETTDDQSFNIGDATNTSDVRFFGATASTVVFDASADQVLFNAYDIALGDGDLLLFGDTLGTGDFSIVDTSDVLVINNVVDGTGTIGFGAAGAGIDVDFHGDAGSGLMTWDENQNTNGALVFNNADIEMGDADFIQFGDTTDATIEWNASLLKIDVVTVIAGFGLQLETTDSGINLNADGAANGDITIDAADVLTLITPDPIVIEGDATSSIVLEGTVNGFETTLLFTDPTANGNINFPDTADEGAAGGEVAWIADAGSATKDGTNAALPVTDALVLGTSTAASAWSLPNGEEGQILTVVIVTDGGEATITPDTANASWATVVLTDDIDGVTFQYIDDTIGWMIIGTSSDGTNIVAVTQ